MVIDKLKVNQLNIYRIELINGNPHYNCTLDDLFLKRIDRDDETVWIVDNMVILDDEIHEALEQGFKEAAQSTVFEVRRPINVAVVDVPHRVGLLGHAHFGQTIEKPKQDIKLLAQSLIYLPEKEKSEIKEILQTNFGAINAFDENRTYKIINTRLPDIENPISTKPKNISKRQRRIVGVFWDSSMKGTFKREKKQ